MPRGDGAMEDQRALRVEHVIVKVLAWELILSVQLTRHLCNSRVEASLSSARAD